MIDMHLFSPAEQTAIKLALQQYPLYRCTSSQSRLKDQSGKQYHLLKVLYRTDNKGQQVHYVCRCNCGNICVCAIAKLKNGHTKSCGCLRKEMVVKKNRHINKYDLSTYPFGVGYTYDNTPFIFDLDDYELIKKYSWYINKGGYVFSSGERYQSGIYLHRLLMQPNDSNILVDHINHDTRDNRRINLRLVSSSQNQMNRMTKGYFYNRKRHKWQVSIKIDGQTIYCGCFNTEQEAWLARKKAELQYYGQYSLIYSRNTVSTIDIGE